MPLIRRSLQTLLIGATLVSSAFAATNPRISVHPEARLTAKIDNNKVAPILGTHPAKVDKFSDLGRLPAGTPMTHMYLVLKGSDAQEFALRGLLDDQQDAKSVNYHQWLTPDTFGANFGVESSDLSKLSGWLKDSGFTVNSITKSARIIDFSGTSAQVEAAFHTEMHSYSVGGKTFRSNAVDLSVPKALTPVVATVAGISNMPLTRNLVNKGLAARGSDGQMHAIDPATHQPNVTFGTAHYIGGGRSQVSLQLQAPARCR